MFKAILTSNQLDLLPILPQFSKDFGLVGGTAVALQIGHRRSIDFDLFTEKSFDPNAIRSILRLDYRIEKTLVQNPNELTILVHGVKFTFYRYPYFVEYAVPVEGSLRMPDLLTLAAMKAFALGGRAKWKDYVDVFFIFKQYSLADVIAKTKEMFGSEFNEKLFREQLSYFDDVNYTETIEYMPGFETSDEVVKQTLLNISLQ